jgi:ATP-binding protein involved in chromosome partitioning
MAGFVCPDCGSEHAIFGEGGGERFAADVDMPFLGSVPLDPAVREGGDDGAPMVHGDAEAAEALREFTRKTANMQGIVHRRRVSSTRTGAEPDA